MGKAPSSTLEEAIAEMLALMKALPPRPSIPEVEIAHSTIAEINKSLADKQAQILQEQRPPDIPPDVFSALQEMRKEALTAQAMEQRRPLDAVIELDDRHSRYDKWIQQAHGAIVKNPRLVEEEGAIPRQARTGERGSARSVLDADWDFRLSTASPSAAATPSSIDDPSNKSNVLLTVVTSSQNQLPTLNLSRSLSWSTRVQPKALVSDEKLSRVPMEVDKKGLRLSQTNSPALVQVDNEDANGNLTALSMLDLGSKHQKSTVLNLQGSIAWVPESLGRMTELTDLNLSANSLTLLPEFIGNLCNLVHLNLSANQLVTLPESIGHLTCLETLNIDNNKIEELPVTIGQCVSLVELKAGFNKLKALPEATGKLSNLRCLHVHLNNLASLPTTMASMTSLTDLDAHFNQLQAIPESLCQVITLTRLNVASNFTELRELPQQIGKLQRLKVLNLSCNQITVLPDSFALLTNLQELDLSGNPLRVPPQTIVQQGKEAVLKYMVDYVTAKDKGKGVIITKKKSWWSFFFFTCGHSSLDKEDEILA